MSNLTETMLVFAPTYCERHGNSLWSEPVNAISNISFFIAAFLIYRLLQTRNKWSREYKLLPTLVLLVGVGSTLWHSLNHPYTLLIDALPIWSAVLLLLFMVLRKLTASVRLSGILVSLFIVLEVVLSVTVPADFFNGSIRHIATATFLLLLLIWSYRKIGKPAHWFSAALVFYVVAIIFRSVDLRACSTISSGTHFVWHLLAPVGFYLGVKFLMELDNRTTLDHSQR